MANSSSNQAKDAKSSSSSSGKDASTTTTTSSTATKDTSSKSGSNKDKNADELSKLDPMSKEDKLKSFENEGVEYKAKLIGSELVIEPRGDKMCQSSIQRLKAMVKGLNTHKRRILLRISFEGVKVYDEKTNEILHHHKVPQISYIASDDTDSRTFGYVCDLPNKGHQFICFKTSGPAIVVMSTISFLFDAVLERKNKMASNQQETIIDDTNDTKKLKESSNLKSLQSLDIVGDSGIMDTDLSFSSDINYSKIQANQHERAVPSLADSILSHYGSSDTGTNTFNQSQNNDWTSSTQLKMPQSQFLLNQQQQHQQQQHQNQSQSQQQQQQQQHHLSNFPQRHQANFIELQQSIINNKQSQPQKLAVEGLQNSSSADLLFSDLFFGLSDPIIVNSNDSLVTNKLPLDNTTLSSNQFSSGNLSHLQQQQQSQSQFPSNFSQQHHQQQQHNKMMMNSGNTNSNPFDLGSGQQQQSSNNTTGTSTSNTNMNNSAAGIMRPRPSATIQAPQPIPPRTGLNRQSSLASHASSLMSPLSLPRPGPMMQEPASRHNRSLVHNHSSVSLSDAALTRQFSFNTSPSSTGINQVGVSDSYVDRYSVFNDIDNLPSIFESTSLGNVNSYHPSSVSNANSSNLGSMGTRNNSSSRNMNMQGRPTNSAHFN